MNSSAAVLECPPALAPIWPAFDSARPTESDPFLVLDTAGTVCRGAHGLGPALLAEIRDTPAQVLSGRFQLWCKESDNIRVAAVALTVRERRAVCYWKTLERRGIWSRLMKLVRRSHLRQAWLTGNMFLRHGIPTPRPLAFIDVTRGASVREELITEGVPHTISLKNFLITIYRALPAGVQQTWRRRIIEHLADPIRKMHRLGFDHRDLKASNILVSRDLSDARVWVMDLDDVRNWPWLPRQRIVQNLARLNVSAAAHAPLHLTDRLRFLKQYLGRWRKSEWKPLWREISRGTLKKIRKNQRNARPLN